MVSRYDNVVLVKQDGLPSSLNMLTQPTIGVAVVTGSGTTLIMLLSSGICVPLPNPLIVSDCPAATKYVTRSGPPGPRNLTVTACLVESKFVTLAENANSFVEVHVTLVSPV